MQIKIAHNLLWVTGSYKNFIDKLLFFAELFSSTQIKATGVEWQWNFSHSTWHSKLWKSCRARCIPKWWVYKNLLFYFIFLRLKFLFETLDVLSCQNNPEYKFGRLRKMNKRQKNKCLFSLLCRFFDSAKFLIFLFSQNENMHNFFFIFQRKF